MDQSRAQSEVVGVVLLTGVVVVLVSLVGVVILSDQPTERAPVADVTATIEEDGGTDYLVVEHGGGDDLELSTVDVTVTDGGTSRYDLGSFSEATGDGDDRFEPGEVRRLALSQSGELRVLVVRQGRTGRLLFDEVLETP